MSEYATYLAHEPEEVDPRDVAPYECRVAIQRLYDLLGRDAGHWIATCAILQAEERAKRML